MLNKDLFNLYKMTNILQKCYKNILTSILHFKNAFLSSSNNLINPKY